MKVAKRTIGKNGVQLFQPNWSYYHPAMAMHKRMKVEVRYSDDDYNRVWVVLPDLKICEAERIVPTSLINVNHQTLNTIKKARAIERALINDFHLITQSNLRGESTEDRVAKQLEAIEFNIEEDVGRESVQTAGEVHRLTRFDKPKLRAVKNAKEITASDVASAESDTSIFIAPTNSSFISEFDDD